MTPALPPNFDPDSESLGDGIFGLPTSPDAAALVLIPVPWDATVSYRGGTAAAPAAILEASHQVELYDRDTGHPYRAGIAIVDADPQISTLNEQARAARSASQFARADQLYLEMVAAVAAETVSWTRRGKQVGIVGGEHGVGLGAVQAVAGGRELGVLQLDAHADLRSQYQGLRYSHATMANSLLDLLPAPVRAVQVGVRDCAWTEMQRIEEEPRVRTFFDQQLTAARRAEVVESLPARVWVSLDIDALDPSLCPNTGTPVPGGISWREAMALLAEVFQSGRSILGFDLCEVVPQRGPRGLGEGLDEIVAARLLYKLCGWTLARQT